MLTQLQMKNLADFFKKKHVQFAYLYGSQTTHRTKKNSDVDIAIYPSKKISPTEYLELADQLSSLLNKEIDLVTLPETSLILRYEMLKSGKLIYAEKEAFFQTYVMHTLGQYIDFKQDRKIIENNLIKRIKHGQ